MSVVLLHTGDWHFAVKNPVSRIDSYNDELFASLDNILKLVRRLDASGLCIAGDIFHNKDKAPWPVVIRLLEWGQQVRQTCDIYTIRGNHDLKQDRFESVEQTPYGALMGSGIYHDISRRLVPNGVYGPKLYGIPWPDGASADCLASIPKEADVVLIHGWGTPEGAPRYGNFCHRYEDLGRAAPWVRVWHFGHDHSDQGVYTLKNGAKVINIGALSRGALDTDNITRQVKVAVSRWDLHDAFTVDQVLMPVPAAADIFDMAKRERQVKEKRELEGIVRRLTTSLSPGAVGVTYQEVLARTELDAAVRTKVEHYLENAEATGAV